MAFSDYEYRDGVGYFHILDDSGPYWLDQAGTATLMISKPRLNGAAASQDYEYRDGTGWFHKATGAGPYVAG